MFTASWCKSLPMGIDSKVVYYQSLQELIDTVCLVAVCECPSIIYPVIWLFDGFKSNKHEKIEGAFEAGTAHDITFIITPELFDEIILKDSSGNIIGSIKILF